MGDIDTLTLSEYLTRSAWGRLMYRLYRHPAIMFGVGPSYMFLLKHRIPGGLMDRGWKPWASTMGTNLGIVIVAVLMIMLVGWKAFLLVQLPIAIIAATYGVWLFFVQHQFENATWEHDENWDWHQAALFGSSYYDLPKVLHWMTANIGVHHVHHLCSGIPYYRLPQVMRDFPMLQNIGRITLWESFKFVRLALWDEASKTLVSFRDVRRLQTA